MKFTYVGDGDNAPQSITFMGKVKFELNGKAVEVKDELIARKLAGNRCFTAGGKADPLGDSDGGSANAVGSPEPTYSDKLAALAEAQIKLQNRKGETVNQAYAELTD